MTLGDYLRTVAERRERRHRPALVVQGGGLRGIYSMAALAVLEENGLRDAFSLVVGSSAGAINGAYFLAGQASEGVDVYVNDLSGHRFVSPWRLWKIVDVDYMIDVTLKHTCPLDTEAMLNAPAPLHTVLTDADTAESEIVSTEDRDVDIYEVFRATAALPGLYNRKVKVGDRYFVDGGVAGLVPLDDAFAHGANEALVLLTRGLGHRRSDRSWAFRSIARLLSHGQSPQVRQKICEADETYNEAMERLEGKRADERRRLWALQPTNLNRLVNRTTNDFARLRDCAELGRADMHALLEQDWRGVATTG